ncbi:MAG: hypothetical protein WD873_04835, partial [Candidatus Hydrogenedentales bacterium]
LGGVFGTVQFTTDDGAEHQATVYVAENELHPASVTGKDGVRYLVPASEIESAMPPAETLVAPEEEPASEVETPPAEEAEAPSEIAPEVETEIEAPDPEAEQAAPDVAEETETPAPAPN